MSDLATGPALVIAPHPDDEVLGCGGTIARFARAGVETHVAIVTRGMPPAFDARAVEAVREEARAAHELLGVAKTHWLELPAAALDQVPHAELNRHLGTLVAAVRPATLFVPFVGDIHLDHQLVFQSALVAARPTSANAPRRVYAYETLSETNWNAPGVTPGFQPNVFIGIEDELAVKLQAMRLYGSQLRAFPSERSVEAVEALARLRGASVFKAAAEAFVLVREIA